MSPIRGRSTVRPFDTAASVTVEGLSTKVDVVHKTALHKEGYPVNLSPSEFRMSRYLRNGNTSPSFISGIILIETQEKIEPYRVGNFISRMKRKLGY